MGTSNRLLKPVLAYVGLSIAQRASPRHRTSIIRYDPRKTLCKKSLPCNWNSTDKLMSHMRERNLKNVNDVSQPRCNAISFERKARIISGNYRDQQARLADPRGFTNNIYLFSAVPNAKYYCDAAPLGEEGLVYQNGWSDESRGRHCSANMGAI